MARHAHNEPYAMGFESGARYFSPELNRRIPRTEWIGEQPSQKAGAGASLYLEPNASSPERRHENNGVRLAFSQICLSCLEHVKL
jgi:hypothetical protein